MAPDAIRDPETEPTHPGELLREDVLPALGLTTGQAAEMLRITPDDFERVLSRTAEVTPELAIRLGKLCGNGPGLWLRMQAAFDLWHAQRKLGSELEAIPTLQAVA